MKTWEMIKELSSNPNLKFKRDYSGSIFLLSECGNLVIERGGVYTISPNEEWELVREPVTWQKAIQAWIDGKNIRVELDGGTLKMPAVYTFGYHFEGSFYGISKNYFTCGKWYIED